MNIFNDLLLIVSEFMVVIFGALISYVSLRAYRRNKSASMLALSIGFFIIVVGSTVEEIFLDVFRYPLIEAHIVENFLVAIGLLVIVYSLYGARG